MRVGGTTLRDAGVVAALYAGIGGHRGIGGVGRHVGGHDGGGRGTHQALVAHWGACNTEIGSPKNEQDM